MAHTVSGRGSITKAGSGGGVGVYGVGLAMDTLANIQVGPNSVSYRFRAVRSGSLIRVRVYIVPADPIYIPGYAGGTGGTIRLSIQTDNGAGIPSGTILGYVDAAGLTTRADDVFTEYTFNSPAPVTAGGLYHLVWINIDPSPTVNYISADCAYRYSPEVIPTPRQPGFSDDFATLRKVGAGSWTLQTRYTPIVDLTWDDDSHWGMGYMEVEVPNECVIAGTTSMTREWFTVSGGARTVTGGGVRIAKTSGSGDLLVRLEDSGGNLIDSFTASTASVPVYASVDGPSGVWVTGTFSAPRVLANGGTYYLRLSTDASTSLWTRGIQQGNAYGFHASTYFTDGILQVTTNGGASWATVSGLGAAGDMQFYLTTTT